MKPTRIVAVYVVSEQAMWGTTGTEKVMFLPTRCTVEIVVGEFESIHITGTRMGMREPAQMKFDNIATLLEDAPDWALGKLDQTWRLIRSG